MEDKKHLYDINDFKTALINDFKTIDTLEELKTYLLQLIPAIVEDVWDTQKQQISVYNKFTQLTKLVLEKKSKLINKKSFSIGGGKL